MRAHLHTITRRQWLAVVVAGLCSVVLACEFMRFQTEEAAMQVHQDRFSCLAQEITNEPSCAAVLAGPYPPEDADFCSAAVAICKNRGLYAKVVQADERMLLWDRVARMLRFGTFLAALCSVLSFALLRMSRRLRTR
jgi:hypothetical protein